MTAVYGAATVVIFWAMSGANRGWTKTSVPHTVKDPVTELDGVVYVNKFVPGVDILGAGLLISGLIAAVSFALPRKR